MKKLVSIILFFIAFSAVTSYSQNEQPLFYIGGYGGLNYNMHSAEFTSLEGYYTCCPSFSSGNGLGFTFGGLFQYPLNNDQSLMLNIRLGYSKLSGEILENDIIGNTEVRQTTPPYETIELIKAEVEHSVTGNISLLALEPSVSYYIYNGFHVTGGASIGFMINPTFDQYEMLVSPNNVVFSEEGTLKRNIVEGDELPDAKSLQIHAIVGLGYDIPIARKTYVTPEVKYYHPFMDITSRDWKISTFYAGISIKTPIFPPKEKPIIKENIFNRDTVEKVVAGITNPRIIKTYEDTKREKEEIANAIIDRTIITETYEKQIPKEIEFSTDLEVTGISSDGKRRKNPVIIIEEIETEEMFPLLPYIFFDEGKASLSNTGLNLFEDVNNNNISNFNEDKLPWNTLDIYSKLLDIVGLRMKNNPNTKITLTGCNNNIGVEENNLDLSRQRAENVKDYLVTTWKINPNRISTEARNLPEEAANNEKIDGQAENRRVEISSNNHNILAPIKLKEIIKTVNPPHVEIEPKAIASEGLQDYNISIIQGDSLIRKYSGNRMPEKIIWKVDEEPMPKLETPIDIEFSATDSTGKTKDHQESLVIKQLTINKKRVELKEDNMVEKFSLIVFDFNKANITEKQKKTLNYIKSRIQPDSKVTIAGYTDRTGETEYNRDLAKRRAENAMTLLGLDPSRVTIKAVGKDYLLYDNDSPQGRNYSRTVQIIIETPIKTE